MSHGFPIGSRVCLHGLQTEKYNGQVGLVVEYHADVDRFSVKIESLDTTAKFRSTNFSLESEYHLQPRHSRSVTDSASDYEPGTSFEPGSGPENVKLRQEQERADAEFARRLMMEDRALEDCRRTMELSKSRVGVANDNNVSIDMAFVDVRKPTSSVAQPPSFPPPPFSQPPQNREVQTSTGTYARVPIAVPAVGDQQRLANLFAEAEQARAEHTEARIVGGLVFAFFMNTIFLGVIPIVQLIAFLLFGFVQAALGASVPLCYPNYTQSALFVYFCMVLVLIGARVAIAVAVVRYYTSQHMTVFLIGPMIIAGLATIFDIVRGGMILILWRNFPVD